MAPTKEEDKEPPAPTPEPETPAAEEEPDEPITEPVVLPPREKYILDGRPEITTIGHIGDQKDKIIKVKVGVKELPTGFEFADKTTELQFMQDVAAQELTARQLETQYNQQVQKNAYDKALNEQALDVAKEITQLQDAGLLGKFQYSENDPKFNDDPAVVEANAIYKVFEDTNNKYIREGRSYRITYTDAADKYLAAKSRQEAQKPKEEPKKTPETPPTPERTKVAEKVSAPGGSTPGNPVKGAWPGMSSADIVRMVNRGQI